MAKFGDILRNRDKNSGDRPLTPILMTAQQLFDRRQAGRDLAVQLSQKQWHQSGWVIALPRGGVPVGYEIAQKLGWPLDIWLVRKLGVPGQPELAMGAIAAPQTQILNQKLIHRLGIPPDQIQAVVDAEHQELQRRDRLYRRGKPLPSIKNQAIILVDDGLATGATMRAAIIALQQFQPASMTAVAPVAASESVQELSPLVDDFITLVSPESMGSISQWYVHFAPVGDQAVINLLNRA